MDVSGLFRVAARHHVELLLSGHDHDYERFARLDAHRQRDRNGTVQFVSGLGGRSMYRIGPPTRGSRVRIDNRFGVLRLRLGSGSARFAFKTLDGRVRDRGVIPCR
jgi:hypothetical protein